MLETECGSLDGGDYGEHSGFGFVEISILFVMWDAVFCGKLLFVRVYRYIMYRYVFAVLIHPQYTSAYSTIYLRC